jgi:hypothetical protein
MIQLPRDHVGDLAGVVLAGYRKIKRLVKTVPHQAADSPTWNLLPVASA